MSLGENIKKYRKLKKLTQLELAKRANMSRSYLADVERDRYNPSVDTLKSIAKVLEIDPNSLLGVSQKEYESIEDIENALNKIIRTLSEGPYSQKEFYPRTKKRIDEELKQIRTIHEIDIDCTPADILQLCKEVGDPDFTKEIIEILERVEREEAAYRSKINRDIAKDLERIMENLESETALSFHGEPINEETKRLLQISLENSMRLAKEMAKKKFDPRKNKK